MGMTSRQESGDGIGIDADEAWTAVQRRDRGFDGSLVYAVRTTGVYCRPSCPSRRPHRRNVEFFEAPADAEAAGYRACLRCAPSSGDGTTAEKRVRKAVRILEQHPDESITLADLAQRVGLSPFHLQRMFKRIVGVSPRAFQDGLRMGRLRERLRQGDTVSRAAYEAGFGSSRGVYDRAEPALGMTPGEYRRGGRGLHIRWTTAACALGRVLVGSTQRGICSVVIGDADADLKEELDREFPAAVRTRDDQALRSTLATVLQQIDGAGDATTLPLDLQGTAFQLRVWSALQRIPAGATRSYAEIAAAIGQPTAARAVAQACAANRTAVLVPCHRVVRTDGSTGGYRWGPDRKQRLLEAERDG